MAFQSVPDCAEVVVEFLLNSVSFTNTFYGIRAGGYDATSLAALADAMDAWVGTDLLPYLGADTAYVRTTARGLEFITDLEEINSDSAGVGGVAVQALPVNLAFCVKRETGLTGRSARGRVYLAGFGLTYLSSNENFWDAADMVNVVNGLNNISTDMLAAGWTEVVVSRYTGGAKRSFGVTFPVTSYVVVDYRLDSRRDRLPTP